MCAQNAFPTPPPPPHTHTHHMWFWSAFLFESALGLRFAMRQQKQQGSGTSCTAAVEDCVASLPLPWDAVQRLGLDCAHARALCTLYTQGMGRPGAGSALAAMEQELKGLGLNPLPRRPLRGRIGLTVTRAAWHALGRASGWRSSPVGNVSFSWATTSKVGDGPLNVWVTSPAGADTLLELPLITQWGTAEVKLDRGDGSVGGGSLLVNTTTTGAGASVLVSLEGTAHLWFPRVAPCAGEAAAFVEVRSPPRQGKKKYACDLTVLVMAVPPGEHSLTMSVHTT